MDCLLGILQAKRWQEEDDDKEPNVALEDGLEVVELGKWPRGRDLQNSLSIYLCIEHGLL